MKKMTALLMAFALAFACVGCGSDNAGAAEEAAPDQTAAEDAAAEETETEEAAPEETDAADEAEAADETAETESEEPAEAESAGTEEKSEGVMTYEEYAAAELDTEVVVETYVQAKHVEWGQAQESLRFIPYMNILT